MSFRILRQKRILISRIIVVFLLFVFLFTRTEIKNDLVKFLLNYAGLLFVAVGALGRIWSSMYICGYKKKVIINTGPYAAVRNPLYLFSFIGMLGLAMATVNYIFMTLIVIMFLIYYPLVVMSEEGNLKRLHGDLFREYMESTPRFIPNLKKLILPDKYEVDVKTYSRAFLDAIWFFIAYILIDVVKLLQAKDAIPLFVVM